MLESWMDQIVDNFLSMTAKASPSVRTEIIARVTAAFTPQSPLDPGASPDKLPIDQGSTTVSAVHVDHVEHRIVDADQKYLHPHLRKDPEMNPRPTRKLRMGRPLREYDR